MNHVDRAGAAQSTEASPALRQASVSAIATFHAERMLAHWMLNGFDRVRRRCDMAGIKVELVAVLDRADPDTRRIVESHPTLRASDQLLHVDNGDLGESRNDGFRAARSHYAGTFDGDDYYSANWIEAALQRCQAGEDRVIVHPELVISFGDVHAVMPVLDLSREDYPKRSCLKIHPWISSSFASLEVYRRHPYEPTRLRETGFGYEDWHWNLETWAEGLLHVTAPRTALFYRRRGNSMLAGMNAQGAIVRPGRFFDELAEEGRRNLPAAQADSGR